MPILERDPWRFQFFDGIDCPNDVFIPTDDADAWDLFPAHRWIYDKLRIAESQGLAAGPHGLAPSAYPVFSKPAVNLKGMGVGSRAIHNAAEMEEAFQPGHMWMPLLTGAHVSTDCAVVSGRIVWLRHAIGEPLRDGMFRHWTIGAETDPTLQVSLSTWVERHMQGYTGMMNFETIGGQIIEAHLRFADQWCDLYGDHWANALVSLYATGSWRFTDEQRVNGYSLPLFASHGDRFKHPSEEQQRIIRRLPHVSSLQITFHETKAGEEHPMPPGGFRLGIINATDFAAGKAARYKLADAFPGVALITPD